MSDVHRKDVELFRGLEPVLGTDVTVLLLERLPPPTEDLATKADLEPFATRADLERELERFATKADLEPFVTKADLERELERVATKADLHEVVGNAIQAQTRTLLFGICGILTALAALVASFSELV